MPQTAQNAQTSPPVGELEESLYEVRKKIYPRSVHGWWAGWRWALVWITQVIYYGLPWLTWNERQAVLFDLAARKFYIVGLVFWPQDVIYLTVLLIISAHARDEIRCGQQQRQGKADEKDSRQPV